MLFYDFFFFFFFFSAFLHFSKLGSPRTFGRWSAPKLDLTFSTISPGCRKPTTKAWQRNPETNIGDARQPGQFAPWQSVPDARDATRWKIATSTKPGKPPRGLRGSIVIDHIPREKQAPHHASIAFYRFVPGESFRLAAGGCPEAFSSRR